MSNDAPAGGPSPARNIQDFFGWIRGFGIYRPDDDRWISGVAIGLARRWGMDPILVRGIFVALTFAGGLGVAAYGIAWLLLPQQDGRVHLQEAIHGHFTAGFIGAALLSLALFGDPGWSGDHWFAGPPRFLALLLLIGLIWWMGRHQSAAGPPDTTVLSTATSTTGTSTTGTSGPTSTGTLPPVAGPGYGTGAGPGYGTGAGPVYGTAAGPPPVPPPPAWTRPEPVVPDPSRASKRITRTTLGVALIVGALVGFVAAQNDSWNRTHPAGLVGVAAALAVIAGGVLWAGVRGRRSGGLAFAGFIIAGAVLIGAGVHSAGVRSGQVTQLAGDYTWTPSTVTAAEQQYNLGVGEAELRLTDPAILADATPARPLHVSVRMGAGHLTVTTPAGVPVTVHVKLGAGELYGPNGQLAQSNSGDGQNHNIRHSVHLGPAGTATVVVDVQQGAGQIDLATTPAPSSPAAPAPSTSAAAPSTPSKETTHA